MLGWNAVAHHSHDICTCFWMQVQHAVLEVDSLFRVKAYLAWLRYHVARATSSADKLEAVRLASVYCTVLGFNRAPLLNSRTIKALGLKGIIDRTDPLQGEGNGG